MNYREVTYEDGTIAVVADIPGQVIITLNQPHTEIASEREVTQEEHDRLLDQIANP